MQLKLLISIGVFVLMAGCASTPQSVLADSQKAMGDVTSLRYAGTGANGNFGQAILAGQEWPRRELTAYTRSISYEQKASSEVIEYAQPTFGGQKQNPVVNGDKAWNVADAGPTLQPAAADGRQLRIWMTPHGFLKAAANADDLMLSAGQNGAQVLTFTARGTKHKMTGTIDGAGMVTRVESEIADPVLGDTPVIANYSEYADHGGVKFPNRIVEEQGGFMVLELTVNTVEPNPAVDLPVPAVVATATVPPVVVTETKLANGVWHLTGGSHHSLLVEFEEFSAVVEGPLNDARGVAVIAAAKRLVPTKPIKYVVSTHHHFDHSGGLRAFVAEGATVVTHASNVEYFTEAFKAPATIEPDSQARAGRTPMFEAVTDKFTITDGMQTIEVHSTMGDSHTGELLVAYLPRTRLLVEADSYSPNDPTARPMPPPPNAVALYDNIERLKLNVAQIAPIHGRGAVPIAEFRRFVGK